MTITKKVTRRNVGEVVVADALIDVAISGRVILVCADGAMAVGGGKRKDAALRRAYAGRDHSLMEWLADKEDK